MIGVILAVLLGVAGVIFGAEAKEIYDIGRSSIHEIYAGIYMLASVLCFGFGSVVATIAFISLDKENKEEKQ